jgi:hypothetical protein
MNETRVHPEHHELESYLHDVLGVVVKTAPWRGADRLPHYLMERYTFAEMELLGLHAVLVVDTHLEAPSPATVRKHMDMIQAWQHMELIYVRAQVTGYNRKRLIGQKVPFIVPGNQMYLPMLAIDLREHFRRMREESTTFSPSTQVVVLYALLRDAGRVLIPTEIGPLLGYTSMTMSRAFDELETSRLAQVTVRGRERCLRFNGSRREIWENAQPFLRSPVNKRLFIFPSERVEGAIGAGLTALAHYSVLAAPACMTYALSREDWTALRNRHKIIEVPAEDPDAIEIESWWYPPAIFAENGIVDPFSLYLSLKADQDEGTETALEEMMEKVKW